MPSNEPYRVTNPDLRRDTYMECPICNEMRYYAVHPSDIEGGIRLRCKVCGNVPPMRCTTSEEWEDVIPHWPELTEGLITMPPIDQNAMFDDLPDNVDEIPDEYLSGIASFVASGGADTAGMEKEDYIYAINQAAGVERVPAEDDDRANTHVVPTDEVEEDEALSQDEYTSNVLGDELEAWAKFAIQQTE